MEGDISTLFMLRKHVELEEQYDDGDDGNFLSGWQCENPFSGPLQEQVSDVRSMLDSKKYQRLDDDKILVSLLADFHENTDGVRPQALFCGEGSSSILFTFCAWLKDYGTTEVFYIPPLYYTLHFALKIFGIHARPVSGSHAYEDGFVLNLPPKKTTLLLSDPVWYAGMPLTSSVVCRIADWQRKTRSLVFVDGSFQYLRWDGQTSELTATLDPARTFRLICPTKILALGGYRFAYGVIPAASHKTFANLYSNIFGSDTAENIAFARVSAQELAHRRVINPLIGLTMERHRRLREAGAISAPWNAACGYFVFERILHPLELGTPLMDGAFFEQQRHKEYRRINLLSPSIGVLH